MNILVFIINSIFLGTGLAMDAFSVSVADGLAEPRMRRGKMLLTAGTFAFFQALMPMLGWVTAHTAVERFSGIERFIPLISAVLLTFIGGKMILDSVRSRAGTVPVGTVRGAAFPAVPPSPTAGTLPMQAIATSIDALSAGFAAAEQPLTPALLSAAIIAAVTFGFCMVGLMIGKRAGKALSGKAQIIGGAILIAIGARIFFGR